jgi:hypothetical protein
MALKLVDQGLIGQFTGLWPSPRAMMIWIQKSWKPLIKGQLIHFFYDQGFYAFLFKTKEENDLIFLSGPYFYGTRGIYINIWPLDFNLENDIPLAVPIWVNILHIPLHCWNETIVRSIGDALGKYIDHDEPKDSMFSCADIYVEVDLEKGFSEAI